MPLKNDYHHLPIEKSANENIEYIWQCWLQGIEQAPDLVKMCLNSVEKYKKSNQKRIIITAENFADYLTLPTTIIEKWRKGNISNTQFFRAVQEEKKLEASQVLEQVYTALTEKGYNPINQIVGYIMSGDPTYITSHKSARSLIMKVERDEILEELVRFYLAGHTPKQS